MYALDQLAGSVVRVLDPAGETRGSGFVIRRDGYIVTCHHVICDLPAIEVEYQGKRYPAAWREPFSSPDTDLAVLQIPLENAVPVRIVNPEILSGSVFVYGFPIPRLRVFPKGFDFRAESIRPSPPVATLSTFRDTKIADGNPWNRLPLPGATFRAYRIDAPVERGVSGGPVFVPDLGGVVGVMQSTGRTEAYVIRWENMQPALLELGVEPLHNAICGYLRAVEEQFSQVGLFHVAEPVDRPRHYIAVRLAVQRTLRSQAESSRARVDEDSIRAYATQQWEVAARADQITWVEAKERWRRVTVLADPGMGKSTLLREEARVVASRERHSIEQHEKAAANGVLPIYVRLADVAAETGDVPTAVLNVMRAQYGRSVVDVIETHVARELQQGGCVLLLDGLDEVALDDRKPLSKRLRQFARDASCPIYCTSRIAGYSGSLLDDMKELEILPLNWSQTTEFVKHRFSGIAAAVRSTGAAADGLVRALRQRPQLRGLAQNPLLLSVLCSLYEAGDGPLPTRRHEIYAAAVELMMKGSWRTERADQAVGVVLAKKRLLETLAFSFSAAGKQIFSYDDLFDRLCDYLPASPADLRTFTAGELITELSEGDGMLATVQTHGQKLVFLHRTIQEFFTASHVSRVMKGDVGAGTALVSPRFWDPEWHETLVLLAGLLDDATPLLDAIVAEEDDAFSTMLLLAGRCVAAASTNNGTTADIRDKVTHCWLSSDFAIVRYGAAETLVEMMAAESEAADYVGCMTKPNVSAEARYALAAALAGSGDDRAGEQILELLRSRKPRDAVLRDDLVLALGMLRIDKAVPWLLQEIQTERYDDTVWSPARALGMIGAPAVLPELLEKAPKIRANGSRRELFSAIARIGQDHAVPFLKGLMFEPETDHGDLVSIAYALRDIGDREMAASAAGQLADESIPWQLRWLLTIVVERPPRSAASVLERLLANPDVDRHVKIGAAAALASWTNTSGVEHLWQALGDPTVPLDWSYPRSAHSAVETFTGQIGRRIIRALQAVDPHRLEAEVLRRLSASEREKQRELSDTLSVEQVSLLNALKGYRSDRVAREMGAMLRKHINRVGDIHLVILLDDMATEAMVPDIIEALRHCEVPAEDLKSSAGMLSADGKKVTFGAPRTRRGQISMCTTLVSALARVARDADTLTQLVGFFRSIPRDPGDADLVGLSDAVVEAIYWISRRTGTRVTNTPS
jgi:hypothetical protein